MAELPPVNNPMNLEFDPTLSAGGCELFFVTHIRPGPINPDIHVICIEP